MRVFENFASGKWMEKVAPKLPPNCDLMAIMEAYDKSHLDLQGNQKSFGHYWVLNGLSADEKQKMSNWWTYALRPIILTNKKMRQSMKPLVTAANGDLRAAVNRKMVKLLTTLATEGTLVKSWDGQTVSHIVVAVANSVVDREEAYGIADIRAGVFGKRPCSDCLLKGNQFNDAHAVAACRAIETERARIDRAIELVQTRGGQGGCAEAERLMMRFGNHMRHNPLWDMPHYGMPGKGPYSAVVVAQLHNYYKGTLPNIVQCILNGQLDAVYGDDAGAVRGAIEDWVTSHGVAFPTITESFPNGFNEFSNWDKKHWAALSRCIRCALVGVFCDGDTLEVVSRMLDKHNLSKLDVHTEDTLALWGELHKEHADKRNQLLGQYDKVHFNKDKVHQEGKIPEKIANFGVLDGQSDEGGETAHKTNLKENWRCRNNKRPMEQQQQIANNLQLADGCRAMRILERYHLLKKAMEGAGPWGHWPMALNYQCMMCVYACRP
jgi:hypothetical protein